MPRMKTNVNAMPAPELELLAPRLERSAEVLTPAALDLVVTLHRKFNGRRLELLAARAQLQKQLDAGGLPEFLAETAATRAGEWCVAPVPADLLDRRVEITGPVDRKMIINALNAPVQAFMADFEDSSSPTWENMVSGQINLRDAVNRDIGYLDAASGKSYRLGARIATLIVRPRAGICPRSICTSTASRCRHRCSISRSFWQTTTSPWHAPAPAPISTCRKSRTVSKPGCGTMSSSPHKTHWA